ncbi:MAG: hypothetical protein IT445_05405 [Phycisphaeraceae bacterium]|nr:hypothetical protein [Phycisphaeraceae bacterium]
MIRHRTLLVLVLTAAGALWTSGCASTADKQQAAATSQAIFYPAPPAPPRLQFLTSFADGRQTNTQSTGFSQWVVGTEKPRAGQDSTRIDSPYGVAAHNGRIYICDVDRDRVQIVDFVNKTNGVLGDANLLNNPTNIIIADDGTRYVCDTGRRLVVVFDANDQYVRTLGDPNTCTPLDLAIYGDHFYVTDIRDMEIEVWDREGKAVRTISRKGPGPDELSRVANLDVDAKGNIYVTDMLQQIVKVFNNDGNLIGAIGGRGGDIGLFARPKGIVVDSANDAVYVTDSQWDVVQVFNAKGELLLVFGEPGTEPQSMGLPATLCIDRSSIDAFRQYLDPNFEPQYLLFLTNQFGRNKIAVYAFGKAKGVTDTAYQVDRAEIERIKATRRKQIEQTQ